MKWKKDKEMKRKKEGKKEGKCRTGLIIAAAAAGLAVLAAVALTIKLETDKRLEAQQTALLESREQEKLNAREEARKKEEEQEEALFGFPVESGLNVFDAIKRRPPSVEITEENAEDFIQIESCLIDSKTSKIVLKSKSDSLPVSDDKYYYLFALKSYEESIPEDKVPLEQEYKGTDITFRFPRFFTGTESGAFRKFVIAVKKNDQYVAVSRPHYITNPEAVSKYKSNGEKPSSKKGLLIDPNKLRSGELDDLSVKHAAYNIPVSRILGHSGSDIYPTINYSYNGKSYAFNGQVMSEYDLVFSTLTSKGIEITAIILNDVSHSYPQ